MQKMKKTTFTVAVFAVLALAGCQGQKKIVSNNTEDATYEPIGDWKKVEWKGHRYIQYSCGYQGSICHDPDCPCGKGK